MNSPPPASPLFLFLQKLLPLLGVLAYCVGVAWALGMLR